MRNYLTINDNKTMYDLLQDFFAPTNYYVQSNGLMATNVKKDEQGIYLEVEMPGFKKEEISVDYEKDYLTVKAEKNLSEEDKKGYVRFERANKISRTFLVGQIDKENITAKYTDGVLFIALPYEKQKENNKKIIVE